MKQKDIEVWTDGSCIPNPGIGGWAWVTRIEGLKASGREDPSTNIRMEMTAVIEAIEVLREDFETIRIHTDSQFVIMGATLWMPKWKKSGWQKKGGEIKNLDLWKKLDSVLDGSFEVEFTLVRGHSGDEMNEIADDMANEATGLSFEERLAAVSTRYSFRKHDKPKILIL